VIDDRPEFANKQNVPEADSFLAAEISEAVRNFPISRDTFIVIVTRGHSHDTETLRACIQTEAAYIGMIGSARKIKLLRKTFLEKDWATPEQFDRVYAPIGLEIQSKTVEEIAVSIAAQLVLVRNQVQSRKDESS
jgi:xanthine dehydrogenase accessory factor